MSRILAIAIGIRECVERLRRLRVEQARIEREFIGEEAPDGEAARRVRGGIPG